MALDCRISTGSTVPIYRQLTDQIRVAVAAGRVEAGDQLPSVRAMAARLVINPNTVARAYGDLARDGVIEAQQGKGYFVARQRPGYTRAQRRRRLAPLVDALVSEAAQIGLSPGELLDLLETRLGELGIDHRG